MSCKMENGVENSLHQKCRRKRKKKIMGSLKILPIEFHDDVSGAIVVVQVLA